MKNSTLLKTVLSLSFVALSTIPGFANPSLIAVQPSNSSSSRATSQSLAMAISPTSDITIDAGNGEETTATFTLVHPLLDIPANSLVKVKLKPVGGGIQIVADSILAPTGQVIPVLASSDIIRGKIVTVSSGEQEATRVSRQATRVGGSLAGVFSGQDLGTMQTGVLIGNVLGNIIGYLSPKQENVVNISKDTLIILSIQNSSI